MHSSSAGISRAKYSHSYIHHIIFKLCWLKKKERKNKKRWRIWEIFTLFFSSLIMVSGPYRVHLAIDKGYRLLVFAFTCFVFYRAARILYVQGTIWTCPIPNIKVLAYFLMLHFISFTVHMQGSRKSDKSKMWHWRTEALQKTSLVSQVS